jgi:hypothetical protein
MIASSLEVRQMKLISMKLPEDVLAALREEAWERRLTLSAWLRLLLDEGRRRLVRPPATPAPKS